MMSLTKTWNTVGPSPWMLVNRNMFARGCGLIANLSGGACTYSIEACGQDPTVPTFGTAVNGMDGMTGLTASKNGSLAYACTALRINIASIQSGAPVVTLSIVPAK